MEELAELMLIKRSDELTGHSAVFEDDGRVAYAYLLDGDEIVADVWLYNRAATPEQPERDPSMMPFLNPRGFASSEQFTPAEDESEVAFEWSRDAAGETALRVFIRGDYHALLVPGSKPGWCKLAARDGPLASVLREDD